jgi:hypothetical protein
LLGWAVKRVEPEGEGETGTDEAGQPGWTRKVLTWDISIRIVHNSR